MNIFRRTRQIVSMTLVSVLAFSSRLAKADLFGGDVVVLTQILLNATQQLIQLRQILANGQDSLDMIRDINSGINDALGMIDSLGAARDPGLFKDLTEARDALRYLNDVYGEVVDSAEAKIQKNADQSVAEAISLNNSMYDYANEVDRIGEDIKRQSMMASPKGAQKLTAQSMGVMLHVMNQSLRTQATALKLQAQAVAVQNRKDKQFSDQVRSTSTKLNDVLSASTPSFSLPRL